MKVTLCLAVFCAVLALVVSENCFFASECNHVACGEKDYTIDCLRGECTCSHPSATCVTPGDCPASGCSRDWHCLDQKCRCFGGL